MVLVGSVREWLRRGVLGRGGLFDAKRGVIALVGSGSARKIAHMEGGGKVEVLSRFCRGHNEATIEVDIIPHFPQALTMRNLSSGRQAPKRRLHEAAIIAVNIFCCFV